MAKSRPSYTIPMFDAPKIIETPSKSRPYQDRCIRLARMHVDAGVKRLLLVAPTRSGKMFIIAAITRGLTLPVLFLAHRIELIDQCAEELNKAGVTNLGVIRADDHRTNPTAMVQVASIATLAKREKPWAGQEIIIFIDEAHRAASDSYLDLLAHYPNAIVLGFTATPWRLDSRPLGGTGLFEKLETVCTYQELLKNPDWLLPPDIYAPPIDESQFVQRGSDYDEDQAAVVMEHLTGNIIDHWLKRAHMHPVFNAKNERMPQQFVEGPRRRTIGFACNIAHSVSMCERFERAGVRVAHVDGKTPDTERRAVLKALAKHEIEILFNVNILLEGVNIPEAKCVIHARPTQSLTLWRQSSCRVLTPWKDPKFGTIRPLILDHAGNTDRLDPPHIDLNWSLTTKPHRRSNAQPMKICKACFAYIEAHKVVCPHCGAECKGAGGGHKQREEDARELELRNTEPDAVKRVFFEQSLLLAKSRGFKPGFASFKFKERYGQWPARELSTRAKNEFAIDKLWQDQLARREKKKNEAEAQARNEAEHMADEVCGDPYNVQGAWGKDPTSPESIADAWAKKRDPFEGEPERDVFDDDNLQPEDLFQPEDIPF
jgi:DNA repair protein RadD